MVRVARMVRVAAMSRVARVARVARGVVVRLVLHGGAPNLG
ncbi:hypothetical protein GCM10017562_21620 [Streptomyces roseofulvus]